jgi:hypothetical protein
VTLRVIDVEGDAPVPDDPEDFLAGLAGPTVFHLHGADRRRARVVAGSLHGNEPSGLRAIHRVLATREPAAVDTFLLVGAVEAARAAPRFSHRMLPGRRDLNRCFQPPFDDPDGRIAEEILAVLRAARPEAVIDLHNNTGRNPAYAIATRIDGPRLGLCALFADRFVSSALNLGSFMEAFDDLAPSLTIECGHAGDPAADAVAHAGLVRLMRLPQIDPVFVTGVTGATGHAISILTDPVRVRLRPGLALAFGQAPRVDAHLTLDAEIDRHNFEVLPADTHFGWVRADAGWPIEASDAAGRDRSPELFAVVDGNLVARRSVIPIMLTTNATVAVSDCLFYVVDQRQ